jgi:hypothetical protein
MVTAGIARYMAIECGTPQQQIPTSKIDTFAQLTMDCMESTFPALSRPCRTGQACF